MVNLKNKDLLIALADTTSPFSKQELLKQENLIKKLFLKVLYNTNGIIY